MSNQIIKQNCDGKKSLVASIFYCVDSKASFSYAYKLKKKLSFLKLVKPLKLSIDFIFVLAWVLKWRFTFALFHQWFLHNKIGKETTWILKFPSCYRSMVVFTCFTGLNL